MSSTPQIICRVLASALWMSLCACHDMAASATRTAITAGLTPGLLQGTTYRHVTFSRSSPAGPLYVFIEGDGSPWSARGTRLSNDPTPHHPLALALAEQTSGSVLYLGRPCYFQAIHDAACRAPVWTSQRYSEQVVGSMAAAVNRYLEVNPSEQVVLIGYSGGGVLAILMAPLIPGAAAVTIAANLDVDAWTREHHYEPLDGSLNPATRPQATTRIHEWHLMGGRDEVVPPRLNSRYVDRLEPAHVWYYASFDHVCCWSEQWPTILSRIQAAVGVRGSR